MNGYYIVCTEDYEVNGSTFKDGCVSWHPEGARPIMSGLWRRMSDLESNEHIVKTGDYDMRDK